MLLKLMVLHVPFCLIAVAASVKVQLALAAIFVGDAVAVVARTASTSLRTYIVNSLSRRLRWCVSNRQVLY